MLTLVSTCQMPHCWKSHVAAQFSICFYLKVILMMNFSHSKPHFILFYTPSNIIKISLKQNLKVGLKYFNIVQLTKMFRHMCATH